VRVDERRDAQHHILERRDIRLWSAAIAVQQRKGPE